MSRSMNKILSVVFAGIALSFGAGVASADSITYTLGVSNLGGSYTGPFATVTVTTPTLNSTTATITFNALTNGGYVYLIGDGGSVAVNVNATSWTSSTPTGTNSITGFTPGPYSSTAAGNEDGMGSFNQKFNSFDGFTHSATQVSFTLTNTSGTWASASTVLTGNELGNVAAVHIFACATPCTINSSAAATGFASQVPIPAAAWLFGSGLMGLIAIARRRSSERAQREVA